MIKLLVSLSELLPDKATGHFIKTLRNNYLLIVPNYMEAK